MHRIDLITTGGTIEKTYCELSGTLANREPVVGHMLGPLVLSDTDVQHHPLMNKDSLDLTDDDRATIVECVRTANAAVGPDRPDAVVILHGTDTLTHTGDALYNAFHHEQLAGDPPLRFPVVLTGAMRPYAVRDSDAIQNFTEALIASRLLSPGVYCVTHGRALAFPGVTKDRESGTFIPTT